MSRGKHVNTRGTGNDAWHELSGHEPETSLVDRAKIARLETKVRAYEIELAERDATLKQQRYIADTLRTQVAELEQSRNRIAARMRVLVETLQSAGVPIPRPEPVVQSGAERMRVN